MSTSTTAPCLAGTDTANDTPQQPAVTTEADPAVHLVSMSAGDLVNALAHAAWDASSQAS